MVPRLVKISLLALAVLEVAYVAASAVFLNTMALRNLVNSTPDEVRLGYRWALSPFPGLVYVRGIAFRIQDNNIQSYFTIEKARISIDLAGLSSREFRAKRVDADGVRFLLRFRRPEEEITPVLLAVLPEIPGLTSLVEPPRIFEPPNYGAWQVRLGRVNIANLSEIWIDTFRFEGRAEVSGGFYLYPGIEAEIDR